MCRGRGACAAFQPAQHTTKRHCGVAVCPRVTPVWRAIRVCLVWGWGSGQRQCFGLYWRDTGCGFGVYRSLVCRVCVQRAAPLATPAVPVLLLLKQSSVDTETSLNSPSHLLTRRGSPPVSRMGSWCKHPAQVQMQCSGNIRLHQAGRQKDPLASSWLMLLKCWQMPPRVASLTLQAADERDWAVKRSGKELHGSPQVTAYRRVWGSHNVADRSANLGSGLVSGVCGAQRVQDQGHPFAEPPPVSGPESAKNHLHAMQCGTLHSPVASITQWGSPTSDV